MDFIWNACYKHANNVTGNIKAHYPTDRWALDLGPFVEIEETRVHSTHLL
jgi:hypothetical protein